MKRAHDSDVVVPTEAIHPSRKRRLDYTEADAQLAKIYNDLADDVQAVRLKAAGEVNSADGESAVFYFHPWEIDPGQPRISPAPLRWR